MNDAQNINYQERANLLKDIYAKVSQTLADAQTLYGERRESIQPELDKLQEAIAKLEQLFVEANAELIDVIQEATTNQSDAEQELRQLAVEHFEATGVKTLDENLGVRVNTSYSYETKDAVAWAETNAPVMIKRTVDKKAFESLPLISELDFVTKNESVSAVLKGLK